MAIVVIGVNHRTAPLNVLEQLTAGAHDVPKMLAHALQRDHVAEAVVVSTCNRTEIYAVVERFHDAFSGLRSVLAERSDLSVADIADHLIVDYDDAAITHLFSVACGLESAVIGETEILGQLKAAWELARSEGTVGPQLNALFRHAVHCGKRVRTETAISRSIASASSAAVALAVEHLGDLSRSTALILGTGDMGDQMAVALKGAGVGEMRIANRTHARAVELAERVGGTSVAFDDLTTALNGVDLVLTSTGATEPILHAHDVERLVKGRAGRPLLIVDIAVPRDVHPSVGDIDGVELCDMEDLARFTQEGLERRRSEIAAVGAIIDDELVRFAVRRNARSVAPVIAAMHQHAEDVRQSELDRFASRFADLNDKERAAVEALTHGIVAKLLHQPSVRLGELAGTVRGDRIVEALGDLTGDD